MCRFVSLGVDSSRNVSRDAERLGGLDRGDAGLAQPAIARSVSGRAARTRAGEPKVSNRTAARFRASAAGCDPASRSCRSSRPSTTSRPAPRKRAQFVVAGAGVVLLCGRGKRRHVAEARSGRIGEAHRPALRSLATSASTMPGSAPQVSHQQLRLLSKSSNASRWASTSGSWVVAARTELPVTAMPMTAGTVIGSRTSSQHRKAANIGERFSPRRGSIG